MIEATKQQANKRETNNKLKYLVYVKTDDIMDTLENKEIVKKYMSEKRIAELFQVKIRITFEG